MENMVLKLVVQQSTINDRNWIKVKVSKMKYVGSAGVYQFNGFKKALYKVSLNKVGHFKAGICQLHVYYS